jgi:hypothetical protein
MLREGDVVLSTEYAGAAATHLNIDDTETASKRLKDAVTTFMALKTLPVQDTDCLHDGSLNRVLKCLPYALLRVPQRHRPRRSFGPSAVHAYARSFLRKTISIPKNAFRSAGPDIIAKSGNPSE